MSLGTRLPWPLAFALAGRCAEVIQPHVKRLKAVGSLRRRRETVGDIQFVVEPLMHADLFGGETPIIEPIRKAMEGLGEWIKGGERMMQVRLLEGPTLDLYIVHPPASWGSIVAIRTGPADLGQYCVTAMRGRGYRHDAGYAKRLDTREREATDTEAEFFALAGVECLPPRERDSQALRLLGAVPDSRSTVTTLGGV